MKNLHDFFELDDMVGTKLSPVADKLLAAAAKHIGDTAYNTPMLLKLALSAILEAESKIKEQGKRIEELKNMTLTDELTGVFNRRGFYGALTHSLNEASRFKEGGVVILCDLDDFKQINDAHGHGAGDKVLQKVGELLQQNLRKIDTVARIGGDEFALLLTRTNWENAEIRVQYLKNMLTGQTVFYNGHHIPISLSFGVAPYCESSLEHEVLALADADMYANKRMKQQNSRH